jgi:hypothetical protein
MLNAWAIFLILIASAGAVAGIIHHALFSPKAARPARARVKGGRAGRIASLGSERSPPTFAPRRPDSRVREPEEPIDLPNFEKEIQRIVWALESRAA